MTTALVSVFTGIPVRADVAMTGEITLRGEVLPIGGLKEKLLVGTSRRHQDGIDSGAKCERPGGDSRQRQERPGNRAGALDRQGPEIALERRAVPLTEEEDIGGQLP